MNRFVLGLVALGALLAGPSLAPASAQTMASPGAPARAMAPPAKSMAPPAATMSPVNVNTATEAQLDAIPQIGPKRAAKIIANRPYTVPSDMVTKKALSQGIFDKIKTHVTTG